MSQETIKVQLLFYQNHFGIFSNSRLTNNNRFFTSTNESEKYGDRVFISSKEQPIQPDIEPKLNKPKKKEIEKPKIIKQDKRSQSLKSRYHTKKPTVQEIFGLEASKQINTDKSISKSFSQLNISPQLNTQDSKSNIGFITLKRSLWSRSNSKENISSPETRTRKKVSNVI